MWFHDGEEEKATCLFEKAHRTLIALMSSCIIGCICGNACANPVLWWIDPGFGQNSAFVPSSLMRVILACILETYNRFMSMQLNGFMHPQISKKGFSVSHQVRRVYPAQADEPQQGDIEKNVRRYIQENQYVLVEGVLFETAGIL
jgi:hypothetical protein